MKAVETCLVTLAVLTGLGARAEARVLRVPQDHATIQQAVDAAAPHDRVEVAPGTYCGATLTRPVALVGVGAPTIVGCAAPALFGVLRVGFLLDGAAGASPASGSSIEGFVFDGRGVSNADLAPLSLGVLGRFAHDVAVRRNVFAGTIQAVTDTAGDRWTIAGNRIDGVTALDCTGLCAGGEGVVISNAVGALAAPGGTGDPVNRPEANLVADNFIAGAVPDGFDDFDLAGVALIAADRTAVFRNTVRFPDNPAGAWGLRPQPGAVSPQTPARGVGIQLTNTCCGEDAPRLPGVRGTFVAFNDVRGSEQGIVVDGTGGANTQGLWLWHNLGSVTIEGELLPRRPRRPFRPGAWWSRWWLFQHRGPVL